VPTGDRWTCAHLHVPYDNDPPQDKVLIVKLSAARDELLAQLQTVSRVASTRGAIQALSGVQMLATSSGVELRATDMEVGLRVPLPAQVEREGSVVLPARLLVDVVRSLSGPTVTIELRAAEQDVELVAGNATFHIRTLRGEDFPPFPEPDESGAVRVPAGAFVETILKVANSASRDETRPVLTGILVSASERELRMVATDSYRLSVKETQLEQPLLQSFEANVPARALQELARLVQQLDGEELTVAVRQNQIVFSIAGVVLSSRLIEGQFPNYRQLLPETYEHELAMAGGEVTDVVRRMISAQTPDIGEARESLPVAFQGEPFEIGFNPEFLRDGLEGVESGNIVLKLISPLRPGLIQAGDDAGFLYLIMPIRLNV
jgi:DNA polymerase-3 subunit beta